MKRVPIAYLYPGMTWGKGSARQTYITEALAEQTETVFLGTAPATRSLTGIAKPTIREGGKNLLVVDNAFGYQTNRIGKHLGPLQAKLDGRNLQRVLRSRGIEEYVFWLSVPGPEWMNGVRTDRLVYDCIDPCFLPEQQAEFDAKEYKVAAAAKLIFCTASTLLERMSKVHKHTYLLNNAASVEDFGIQHLGKLSTPEPLRGRTGPIIGYMGTVDWRFDTDIVCEAAKRLPDFTFCIAGRVNQDQEHRVTEMRKLPNVIMPGSVSIADGPAYNAAFDVGLIPYLPGEMCDAINPVKMYMYLSMGKPVVSTWVRECYQNMPLVAAAKTAEEFAAAIREAVQQKDSAICEARVEFARQNTWSIRGKHAIECLDAAGIW